MRDIKVNYIVKKDERMVICVISGTRDYFMDYITKHIWTGRGYLDQMGVVQDDAYYLNSSYTGVARCAEDDEWDEDTGRKIAFNRAKTKLNNSFFKRAQRYINHVDAQFNEMIGIINNYGARLAREQDSREKEIDTMLGRTEE